MENWLKAANNGKINRTIRMIMVKDLHGLRGRGVTNGVVGHGCRSKVGSMITNGGPNRRL